MSIMAVSRPKHQVIRLSHCSQQWCFHQRLNHSSSIVGCWCEIVSGVVRRDPWERQIVCDARTNYIQTCLPWPVPPSSECAVSMMAMFWILSTVQEQERILPFIAASGLPEIHHRRSQSHHRRIVKVAPAVEARVRSTRFQFPTTGRGVYDGPYGICDSLFDSKTEIHWLIEEETIRFVAEKSRMHHGFRKHNTSLENPR